MIIFEGGEEGSVLFPHLSVYFLAWEKQWMICEVVYKSLEEGSTL